MEQFEIAGDVASTALVFAPADDGRLRMTVKHWSTGGHDSVFVRPEWLRPLAAWFAGDATPGIVGHDEYGMPYGRWLAVNGDESAAVVSTHTEARLECRSPYGAARVTVAVRRGRSALTVLLSPDARLNAAAYLRRLDAERWTKSAV